jgi:farnesyl diphosphate synthase
MKTAALIECACRMGAICAKATQEQLQTLGDYGLNLGLAFQIVDDILDVTSTPGELGKATQKDQAAGKLTYPGVFGIEEAETEARRHASTARKALDIFGPDADMLRALADYVVERKN